MIRQTLITDFYKKPFFGWNFFKLIKQPLNYVINNKITTISHIYIPKKQTLMTDYYSTIINPVVDRDFQRKITSYFYERSKL